MPDVSEPSAKVCAGGGMSIYVDPSEWPEGLDHHLDDLLDEYRDFLAGKGVKYPGE